MPFLKGLSAWLAHEGNNTGFGEGINGDHHETAATVRAWVVTGSLRPLPHNRIITLTAPRKGSWDSGILSGTKGLRKPTMTQKLMLLLACIISIRSADAYNAILKATSLF